VDSFDKVRLVLIAILSSGFGSVHAGPAPVDSTATDSASSPELTEIVVTAQRRAEQAKDVPLSVLSFPAAQLQQAGVTDTKDLALVVPGLSFTTTGTNATPAIRGVSTELSQPGGESAVAIYVDGVYIPNQIGNVFDLPDVSRVEVLKGPQGTLFGRNAVAGAINVFTKGPDFTTSGEITASYGEYTGGSARNSPEQKVDAFFTAPLISDVLAASVSGYYDHVDGYLTNDVNGTRSGTIENYLVRPKLLFKPSEQLSFLLGAVVRHTYDESLSLFPLNGLTVASLYPGSIIPTQPWHTAGQQPNGGSYLFDDLHQVNLRSEFTLDAGKFTSITAYTKESPVAPVNVAAAYSPSCRAVVACVDPFVNRYGPESTYQEELDFASRPFGPVSFVAGAFIYYDYANFQSNVNPPISPDGEYGYNQLGVFGLHSEIKTRSYSGFGELYWDATDQLRVIAGVRETEDHKIGEGAYFLAPSAPYAGTNNNAATPRLSVLYKLTSSTNVYATYSQGFKAAVIEGNGISSLVAAPEKINSYEIGIKTEERNYTFNAAVYHYDYKNLQAEVFTGLGNVLSNAGRASITGLDLDGSMQVTTEFSVRGGVSWLPTAKYEDYTTGVDFLLPLTPSGLQTTVVNADGERMLKAPDFTGSLSLLYRRELTSGLLDASVIGYYSSAYAWDLSRRIQTDGYAMFNAQIGYKPTHSAFSYSVWAKNLANKAYISGAVPTAEADAVLYAPPREVGVSVKVAF